MADHTDLKARLAQAEQTLSDYEREGKQASWLMAHDLARATFGYIRALEAERDRMGSHPQEADDDVRQLLEGVVGIVEANGFERLALWERNSASMIWEEDTRGLIVCVGRLNDAPVCVSLFKAKIDGHSILFYDATSAVVDHSMVDDWLATNLPPTAKSGKRPNRVDAMNFHNVFIDLRRARHTLGGET